MKIKITIFILLLSFINGFSQNAILDVAFGIDGKVTTSLTNSQIKLNTIQIQSDGKILTCGDINSYLGFILIRYNNDGSLDTSFGNQGKTINNQFFQCRFSDMKIQSDGKIVIVASKRINQFSSEDLFITRYTSNGILDTSFGDNGYVFLSCCDESASFVFQPDNKIIIAMYDEQKIIRLTDSGEFDSTFGDNGIVIIDTFGLNTSNQFGSNEYISGLILQPDGKIIFSGATDMNKAAEDWDAYLYRLNSDGTIDTSYGTNGVVITDFNGRDGFGLLNRYDDNSIVAVGNTFIGNVAKIILAKYNENGMLDSSFGTDGKVITQTNNPNTFDLCIDSKLQSDGKIVCVGLDGNVDANPFQNSNFLLLRYNFDGSLDTTFSPTGYLTTNFNSDYNFGKSVAIQDDERIVIGGYSYISNFFNFSLARYTFENLATYSFSNENRLSFFPNPANDYVILDKEISSVSIYSIDGKKIEVNYLNNKLDVSSLKKGIFFIVGKNDAGNSFENKLIKN